MSFPFRELPGTQNFSTLDAGFLFLSDVKPETTAEASSETLTSADTDDKTARGSHPSD